MQYNTMQYNTIQYNTRHTEKLVVLPHPMPVMAISTPKHAALSSRRTASVVGSRT